jgi:2-oxoglutarate ferredoxin oxidoreductase subunit alpha
MDLLIRVAGEAGQGLETLGGLLTSTFAGLGLHVFGTETYMSRIRGGLNWFDIRIGEEELFSSREEPNLLVVLAPQRLESLRRQVSERDLIVLNDRPQRGVIGIEFGEEARKLTGAPVMGNTVAAGTILSLLGYGVEALAPHLERQFAGKGREVVDANLRCARRGAELAEPYAGYLPPPKRVGAPDFVCTGNEAIALGAATAGVEFYTGYPMTPSTGILSSLAGMADEYGMVVEQAEDEIAAINMVCGATYAGVPAMTATSGGGFALMVEGIALAGMLELPAVVVLGQRPGPATGLPTRTAQQELLFALHAGHGEFPKAVFAPGTAAQAYEVSRHAIEIAHRFQTPVIILSDQFLADSRKNMPALDRALRPVDRCLLADPPPDYERYADTPDGVSPRAIPGSSAYVVVDSDEHTEDGHITEDLTARLRLQDKRMRKLVGLTGSALPPEWYGVQEAEHLLVAWGSTYGPCREAADLLSAQGLRVAMLHFPQVWPLQTERVRKLLKSARRVTCVECNAAGQFASLLREAGALDECGLMLKYDGMPFTGEEIARRLVS